MTDVDLKNALLSGEATDADEAEETKTIPTKAGDIVVRGLTRHEVLKLKALRLDGTIDAAEYEAAMVSKAMLVPTMTPAEVEIWQTKDKAGGVLGDVTDAITQLSGLGEGAQKSGVSGV